MGKKIDELGNKYGTMVVIREVPKEEKISKDRSIYWELQCELCGEKRVARGVYLRKQGIVCNCQKDNIPEDLTGKTFGRLTVVRMATKEERQELNINRVSAAWCKCSCGNPELKLVRSAKLKNGHTKSCGCLHKEKLRENGMKNFKDLTGQRFGRLIVKRVATKEERNQNNKNADHSFWWCDCDCGTKNILINGYNLISGSSCSCGCLRSKGEELITQILIKNNINFQKEYSFDDLYGNKAQLRFDFAIFNNEQLIGLIECDGGFHRRQTNINNLEQQQQYDKLKDDYCHKHNISLLRIKYNTEKDIKENEILDFINLNYK